MRGRPQQGEELAFANIQVEVFDDEVLAVVALLHATKADQYIVRLRIDHNRTFCLVVCRDLRLGLQVGNANRRV